MNTYYWARSSRNLNICWIWRLRQIIDLWDTNKSGYLQCWIIVLSFDHYSFDQQGMSNNTDSLGNWSAIFTQECGFNYKWAGYLHTYTYSVYRQLFAGHVVSSRPMKRKEKIYQMMIIIIWTRIFTWPCLSMMY